MENFEDNVARLHRYLDKSDARNLCAVFDIGTKATKLLVGPKTPPSKETWGSSAFFNDGQLFPLGSDYDLFKNRLDIKSSGALEGVCYFVNFYRDLLQKRGMATNDMHGVGTAVFRWMNNQKEVVSHIREQTELDIHVLAPRDEAQLSCFSIFRTYAMGTVDQAPLGANDVILLFDQGGGSTEVSYFAVRQSASGAGRHHSLHHFGTVSLQRMFFDFHDGNSAGTRPDPTKNQNRISTQLRRVREYLAGRVTEWEGFPELDSDKITIHAYGMGTALSKCLKGGNIFSQHNRTLTVQAMDDTLARQCQELDNSTQQVRTLYAALKLEQASGGKALSDRLVMLYGLPVYQELLLKFGLDRLRFAGFGLRYGVYYAVCSGLKLEHFDRAGVDSDLSGQARGERIQVFLSYSRTDRDLAKRISADLEEAGINVWLDDAETRVGKSILAKLEKGISESRFLAPMFSKSSLESEWVRLEWRTKFTEGLNNRKITVLPIRLDDCEIPMLLADTDCADFSKDYRKGLGDLLRAINDYK